MVLHVQERDTCLSTAWPSVFALDKCTKAACLVKSEGHEQVGK